MARKTINLDKNTGKAIGKFLSKPFKKTRQYWALLSQMIDRDAQLTFRTQGARDGRSKWKPFKMSTLKTKAGTWRIRYGTDKKGKPGNQGNYIPGARRYSGESKLLQASGLFRKSFGAISITTKRLVYGTRHELASKIMRRKRNVLMINARDRARYSKLFRNWYAKGLFA